MSMEHQLIDKLSQNIEYLEAENDRMEALLIYLKEHFNRIERATRGKSFSRIEIRELCHAGVDVILREISEQGE